MKKRTLSIILALIMALSLVPTAVFAATVVDSGTCGADGDNLTWTLNSDGKLTINGAGKMEEYESCGFLDDPNYNTPWNDRRSQIKNVVISDGVESIGDYAFARCSLTSVTIPNSVTNIGKGVFECCECIQKVRYTGNIADWCGIVFENQYANPLGDNVDLYFDGELLTSATIPSSVTSIGDYAFRAYDGLTSVTIGNGVTNIGRSAFSYCRNLESVSIPDSVISIGAYAFRGCGKLQRLAIGGGVTSIGDSAFAQCNSLKNLRIPAGVTSMGEDVFWGCSLENVYYGGTQAQWETLGLDPYDESLFNAVIHYKSAVVGCGTCGVNLTWTLDNEGTLTIKGKGEIEDNSPWSNYSSQIKKVIIPAGVTHIGNGAFAQCSSLASVTIPKGVKWIGGEAFNGCSSLKSVTIPDSVTGIGDYAFKNCGKLTGVTLPDSITSIGKGAFYYCGGLTRVTIPGGVTSIAKSAFYHCGNLAQITIPDRVTRIGDSAFASCSKLKDVYYKGSRAQWKKITIGDKNACLTNATIHFAKLSAPTVSVSNTATGIKITWNKVTGAVSYKLYRKTGTGSWTLLKTTTGTSCTNSSKLTNNTEYRYKVVAVTGDGKSATSYIKAIYRLAQPKISSVANTSGGIKVTWGEVTGAVGYEVYRKTSTGSWTSIAKTASTSYTDTKLTNGSKYQYKVVTLKADSKSAASAIKTIYRLSRPGLTNDTKNIATRKIIVKWAKNDSATGYQVKYRIGSGTAKTVTVKGTSSLSKTLSSLTKGATYKVYVRAYKTVDGTNYYSAWSSAKSVKIVK